MVDFEKIKPEILDSLRPVNADKIKLFGRYTYGTPDDNSDIDLFLIKDGLKKKNRRNLSRRHVKISEN